MDHIPVFLVCSIAFSASSALPQYSTPLPPQYSTGAPQYSNPGQFQNLAQQFQNPGSQYQNVGSQYSTGAPQYSTAAPQYSSPALPPQYSSSQPQYSPSQSQYSPSQPPYNQYQTTPIPILNQNQELNPDGSYHYGYQTGNGISAEERGAIKNLGSPDNEINSVQGYFSYPGSDGVQYSLTYTADENGFVAQGAHLPTPPPVPAELLKAYEALPPDNNEYDDKGFPINRQGQQGYNSNGRA
ncbi:hypothetical protein V9T40_009023 [Parthenolecanium corni]|uniref:Endocuticle structural glycoprotein SgAbd-2 n=1 Tax=Parthenolecanium corni TaxID=536013 RepID=A0AAN9TMT2_9HEMI